MMKTEWDDIVVALQQANVPSDCDVDLEAVADELDVELTAEAVAHSAWRMAATPSHPGGCINRDGNADGYYENPCGQCEAQLIEFGNRVIRLLEGGE